MTGSAGLAFGGPDLPPRRLRDLLQSQVDASPASARIDWATYYFRDRALAEALIRASDRGVRVRLVVEGNTRRAGVNDAVIAMLGRHGLRGGFAVRRPDRFTVGRMHSKIYAFGDFALVGSFNPSGDTPEDPEVVADIGDQDRGHNLLMRIEAPRLLAALRQEVGRLAANRSNAFARFSLAANRGHRAGDLRLFFYPRLRTLLVEPEIDALAPGDSLRAAISHLKESPLSAAAMRAAGRGVRTEFLVHDTERRVPGTLIAQMADAGVNIRRIVDSQGLPMHAKFLLLRRAGAEWAWLGSYNFNRHSRWSNSEVLCRTEDAGTVAELGRRFAAIASREG